MKNLKNMENMKNMKKITPMKKTLAVIMAIALILSVSLPMMPASAAPANTPVSVNGRLLTPDKTGDIANWVEIAQYGNYSLIVRAHFINVMGGAKYGDPQWQYTFFGANTRYSDSMVRTRINQWFSGTPIAAYWDEVLNSNARLRNFTVQNNALNTLGTSNSVFSVYDGLSLPTSNRASFGNDVAFALSFSECASFLSTYVAQRYYTTLMYLPSSYNASINTLKIRVPDPIPKPYFIWLRTPGDMYNTVAEMSNEGGGKFWLYQKDLYDTGGYGLVYPALWVSADIFGTTTTTSSYEVTYYPNGGSGTVNRYPTSANTSHIVRDQGYTNGTSTFTGWNTEANGSGTTYQNNSVINVTGNISLYAQWRRESSSVVYHSNNSRGEDYADYGSGGTFTIRSNFFTPDLARVFAGWNTSADGRGAILPPGLTFSNFYGTLHLYAIWYIDG